MNWDIVKTPGENPRVLRNMREYLKNPKTVKELYDVLLAMPREEFYDLHKEELGQVWQMEHELNAWPYENDRGRMCHEISCMLRLKDDIEKMWGILHNALTSLPMDSDHLFIKEEEEKAKQYDNKLRAVFANVLSYIGRYKKQLTIEDVYQIKEHVLGRFTIVNKVENNGITFLISRILQGHVYTGKDALDKALRHLMEIHGEDVARPLLWGNDISNLEGYSWDSLLFMRYGFWQITLEEVREGLKKIIKRNKESVNRLIEPAIPMYNWLRQVLEKINNEKEEETQIVLFEEEDEDGIQRMPEKIKIQDINNFVYDNECLKALLKADPEVLEEKLKPLKELCDLSKAQGNLLTE